MAGLSTPLSEVIGGRSASSLRKSHGVHTCEDLLWVFPRRYQDMSTLTDIASLHVDDLACVLARIKYAEIKSTRARKQLLEVTITDGTRDLYLTFFHKIRFFERELQPGRIGLFSGKVGAFKGHLQLAHPVYVLAPVGTDATAEEVQAFLPAFNPIYPATATTPTWRVANTMGMLLDAVDFTDDPLDERIRERRGLISQEQAFKAIHSPSALDDVDRARERFRYQEAFVLQTILALRRQAVAATGAVARQGSPDGIAAVLESRLPFQLTQGQREAVEDIRQDMAQPVPMQRLLHGEVGAGKTLVALLAMTTVVDSGAQAALLAPTEVLAAQHYASITSALGEFAAAGTLEGAVDGTQVVLLTGSQSAAERREAMLKIISGDAGIVVGTHALLNEKVQFADLGLVVVDEQHRFGVQQRAALLDRGQSKPHLLVMTATPIPRTVAMTVFGDLDVTTLRELPTGRAGVTTHVVDELRAPRHAQRMWERVVEEVDKGHKVYVVCPRIGEDSADEEPFGGQEANNTRGVLRVAEELAAGPLSGVRVGVMHGRLPSAEKADAMRRFSADASGPDAIDVLVSTSVIEVGVDVPTATVMIVLDAESFGVSQLHQLRGRVGRAHLPGLCLLSTRNGEAVERLAKVAQTTNGFDLAVLDLEQRKEGDVLGSAQSGRITGLRQLRVIRDEVVIENARADVAELFARDPLLKQHRALRNAVNRWESSQTELTEYADKA